jgi:hypothetical protein
LDDVGHRKEGFLRGESMIFFFVLGRVAVSVRLLASSVGFHQFSRPIEG